MWGGGRGAEESGAGGEQQRTGLQPRRCRIAGDDGTVRPTLQHRTEHGPTMSSATEATRGYTLGALNPLLSYPHVCIARTIAMRAASSTLLTVVCVCSLGAQAAFVRGILAYVLLAGSLFCRTEAALSVDSVRLSI